MKFKLLVIIFLLFVSSAMAEVEFLGLSTGTTDGSISLGTPESSGIPAAANICQDDYTDTDAYMCSVQEFMSNNFVAEMAGASGVGNGWLVNTEGPLTDTCSSYTSASSSLYGWTVSPNSIKKVPCNSSSSRYIACCKKVPDTVIVSD